MATPPVFSVGQVLTSATMNQVGLWEIAKFTGTSGNTVTAANVFTSDFANYRAVIEQVRTTGTVGCSMTLSGGGFGYYWTGLLVDMTPTVTGDRGSNVSSFSLGVTTTQSGGATIDFLSPQINTDTYVHIMGMDARNAAPYRPSSGFRNAAQHTGFSVVSAGTFTNIVITVYGYGPA
jgi:hypothetical protein